MDKKAEVRYIGKTKIYGEREESQPYDQKWSG
jgi:hypothetical protein